MALHGGSGGNHPAAEDTEHHLIGIAAVAEPHRNWKTLLLAGEIDLRYVEQFAALLGTIHRRSAEQNYLARLFDDRTFFETLRLEPYYRYAAKRMPETEPFFADLIVDTLRTRVAVVHGDYSPKNILICNRKLVLLDHEVIHFGDPAFDIGFSLTHLLSKGNHVRSSRASFRRAAEAYVKSYLDSVEGITCFGGLEPRGVRHAIGCLLARVVGRSPLEYLTEKERVAQQRIALELMHRPPRRLHELVGIYMEKLDGCH